MSQNEPFALGTFSDGTDTFAGLVSQRTCTVAEAARVGT